MPQPSQPQNQADDAVKAALAKRDEEHAAELRKLRDEKDQAVKAAVAEALADRQDTEDPKGDPVDIEVTGVFAYITPYGGKRPMPFGRGATVTVDEQTAERLYAEGGAIPEGADAPLETLTSPQLHALAAEHNVDVSANTDGREGLIKALKAAKVQAPN